MRPGASNRSTPRWLARPISRRWRRRSSPVASAPDPRVREAAEAARAAPSGRSRRARSTCSRRPGDAAHRGLRGAVCRRCARRWTRSAARGARRHEDVPLALAGVCPSPAICGTTSVGRARHARRALARETGALRVLPDRARLPRGRCTCTPGSVRRRGGADRGGRRDHAGDRHGTAGLRLAAARPPGAATRAEALELIDAGRAGGRRRGHGLGDRRLGDRRALQRPRPLRGGRAAAGAAATTATRALRAGRCGARRGGVRSGATGGAAAALDRLSERTRRAAPTGRSASRPSRALLSDGGRRALYREAIERLGRSRIASTLARAHLLYGEWLRREHRRVDAREQLRAAHEMFSRIGAEAFAERARRELLATGETVRRRTVETRDVLTPQEAQIARLAGEGQTNPEIGASCSSARAPSSTTCTRCSRSSASPPPRSRGGRPRPAPPRRTASPGRLGHGLGSHTEAGRGPPGATV